VLLCFEFWKLLCLKRTCLWLCALGEEDGRLLFLFYINMLSVISGLVTTIITGVTVASGSVYHYSPRNTKW